MFKILTKKNLFLFFFLLLICMLIGTGFILGNRINLLDYLSNIHQSISADSSIKGLLISELIQILIALCGILPASVAAVSSGMIYGVWKGFLLSASATLIGAVISFLLSRSIFRSSIESFLKRSPRINKLDHLLHLDGWKLVCLLRISPIMPFALTSYALGLTSISIRSYLVGTLASLPALFGYVLIGYLTHNEATNIQTESITSIKHILLLVALIGTGILVWHLGKIIHKILKLPPHISE